MSFPPPHHNATGGYDYNQKSPQITYGQRYDRQLQDDGSHGYVQAQRRVDVTTQYRDQGNPAPLPTSRPQTQTQPWQQTNSYQDQFYSTQSSPQLSHSLNHGSPSHLAQSHPQIPQRVWPQPQVYNQYIQSVPNAYQTTTYTSTQPQPLQYQSQPIVRPVQSNQTHTTGRHDQQYLDRAPAPTQYYTGTQPRTMTAPDLMKKSIYQPQTVKHHTQPVPRSTSQSQISQQRPQKQQKPPPVIQEQQSLPKRRKSNDGGAIPQPASLMSIQHPSSSLKSLHSSQVPVPPTPQDDIELRKVLLSLADEYTTAAHTMVATDEYDTQAYHRLIATAITCLESAIKNFRQTDARQEAYVRLKLAALIFEEREDLIFEEMDNTEAAEEMLSKGIVVCERAHLTDLDYTMQHLLIRVLHSKVPKAALKVVDKLIAEVDALRLTHWIYAFRFLKFSLSSDDMSHETVALLRQLDKINDLARLQNKSAISCLTSCLEVMVNLRSGTSESLEMAQTSLADVRSFQLNPELERLPQLKAMISALDMACHITVCSADTMRSALVGMQLDQEAASKAKGWSSDGSFSLSIGIKANDRLVLDAPGIFTRLETGEIGIVFQWLTKTAMLTMGYLLSGIALLPRNGESRKAETFFKEALKINDTDARSEKSSLNELQVVKQQQRSTRTTIKLIMASTLAARAQYGESITTLQEVHNNKSQSTTPMTEIDRARLKFVTACCMQGLGELPKALDLYTSWLQEFDEEKKTLHLLKDIQVLAILNSVHIMRSLNPESSSRAADLLKSIETYCHTHPNQAFASAYHVVDSTCAPVHTPIMTVKKSLNLALTPAQSIKNKQLLALIMNMMSEMFFTDLVGTQAKSSSNAGRTLAKQSGDNLWVSVGCGMLRDTLERSGQLEEAVEANIQAQNAIDALPRSVKTALRLG